MDIDLLNFNYMTISWQRKKVIYYVQNLDAAEARSCPVHPLADTKYIIIYSWPQ